MSRKIKVSMILYRLGKPVDVAYGEYCPRDIAIFRRDGFINVEEGLARKTEEEIIKKLNL